MKKEIAKNDYYEIYVDQTKNRYYFLLVGLWQYPSEIPDYLDDIKKTADSLSPGFTGLADTRKIKMPAQKVMELHAKGFQIFGKAGLRKVAFVYDKTIIKIASEKVSKNGGVDEQLRLFKDMNEAEDWLDGK